MGQIHPGNHKNCVRGNSKSLISIFHILVYTCRKVGGKVKQGSVLKVKVFPKQNAKRKKQIEIFKFMLCGCIYEFPAIGGHWSGSCKQ